MKGKPVEVPAGGIIHQEKPFVYVLSTKVRTDYCDYCFKSGKLLKCSGCLYVYYCGKVCQKEGWSVHKFECSNLKKVAPRIVPDAARLLARLIKILRNNGNQIKGYYTEKSYRIFKDLMSHYPDLKKDQKRMEHLSSLYGVLVEFLGNDLVPNSAELMGLYGRMCVNSFNICNQELQSLGTGIYLGASILDHSCTPNALATFEGTTLTVRALKTIPNLDFSKIFICYIDVLNTTKERQEELLKTYYFLCECPKCLEPEPLEEMFAACCPNKTCNNFIKNSSCAGDQCSLCNATLSQEFLKEFHDIMDYTNHQLTSMSSITYLDVCKFCLKRQEGFVYKHNIKHVKTLDLAFESSIEMKQFEDAKSFGLALVDSYYKYYGPVHPLTGLLHLKLAKILTFFNEIKDSKYHVKKASDILKTTHGCNSSLYRQEVLPLLFQNF